MTPDLLAELDDALADLEDIRTALAEHGPGYLQACLEANARRLRSSPPRPPQLSATVARALRDIADDAAVRAAARRPLDHRHA